MMERDPVCGMMVDPLKAAAEVEHRGMIYYFCGKSCARKFSADPEHFLQSSPKVATSSAPASQQDVAPSIAAAPLPLSVLSGSPVTKDPVCGMNVEPANAAAIRKHD